MKKLLPKSKFFGRAKYAINNASMPPEQLYELAKEHEDVTEADVELFLQNNVKKNAVGMAMVQGKEQLDKIYNTLDVEFIKLHPTLCIFLRDESQSFFEYEQGVYTAKTDSEIDNMIDAYMIECGLLEHRTVRRRVKDTRERVAASLSNMKGRVHTDETVRQQKWYINLKNGLLDPATRILYPHTPEYFSTSQAPFPYDNEAQCPDFLRFIETVSNNNAGNQRMIQEMFGYCLGSGNPKHKVFYLYGMTARNGKSTSVKILKGLLGHSNVSEIPLSQIASDNNSIFTQIVGKQLNFSDEVSAKYIESANLTSMSAEGSIMVNPKFKPAYSYQVRCKFIVACNSVPRFQEAQGMKHRTVIIPFSYQIPVSQRVDNLDEILLAKEGSGILNWAIQGLELLQINGVFTISKESEEEIYETNLGSDPVMAFLEENYEFDTSFDVPHYIKSMYGELADKDNPPTGFRGYVRDVGIGQMSLHKFQRDIARYANETGKMKHGRHINEETGKPGAKFYTGLKQKSAVMSYQDDF